MTDHVFVRIIFSSSQNSWAEFPYLRELLRGAAAQQLPQITSSFRLRRENRDH